MSYQIPCYQIPSYQIPCYQIFKRNEVLKMYSEDLYYPIIDSISELLKVMIKILTDAVKSVRDSDKCKIQTNKTHLESKNMFSTFVLHFFSAKVVRRSAKFLATELIPYVQLLIKEHTDEEPNQIREIEKSFKDSFST